MIKKVSVHLLFVDEYEIDEYTRKVNKHLLFL